MGVSKVEITTENGIETLMDLTEDTVSETSLEEGVTAHDAAGNLITGTAIKVNVVQGTGTSETDVMSQSAVSIELDNLSKEIVNLKANGSGATEEQIQQIETNKRDIAEIKENLIELSQIEPPKIVSSVAEMVDPTKHYAMNDEIYYCETVTTEGSTVREYPNQFVPSSDYLNKRFSGSSGSISASNGYFITDFIAVPNYANANPYNVRLNWVLADTSKATDCKVMFYNASKTKLSYSVIGNEGYSAPNTSVSNGETVIDLRNIITGAIPTPTDVAYVRLQLAVSSSLTAVTLADIQSLEITLDSVYTETTTEPTTKQEWINSGISYSPTYKTDLVGVLGEDNVIYLSDNLPSGTYTLKYPDDNYATVGTISK